MNLSRRFLGVRYLSLFCVTAVSAQNTLESTCRSDTVGGAVFLHGVLIRSISEVDSFLLSVQLLF